MTEREEYKKPYPKTEEELLALIREALAPASFEVPEGAGIEAYQTKEAEDAYSRSADAMWKCALAAFNYAAHQVGASGFQASWAEMRFLGESRGFKGPFAILDANDMVFPQYDLRAKVEKYLEEWLPWAAEEARRKMAEYAGNRDGDAAFVNTNVWAHWENLAAQSPKENTDG